MDWIFRILTLLLLFSAVLGTYLTCHDCSHDTCDDVTVDRAGKCRPRFGGKCFYRQDPNGLTYRGCADQKSWPNLDTSYTGCRQQYYMWWDKTPVLWCFCDSDMCNTNMDQMVAQYGDLDQTGNGNSGGRYDQYRQLSGSRQNTANLFGFLTTGGNQNGNGQEQAGNANYYVGSQTTNIQRPDAKEADDNSEVPSSPQTSKTHSNSHYNHVDKHNPKSTSKSWSHNYGKSGYQGGKSGNPNSGYHGYKSHANGYNGNKYHHHDYNIIVLPPSKGNGDSNDNQFTASPTPYPQFTHPPFTTTTNHQPMITVQPINPYTPTPYHHTHKPDGKNGNDNGVDSSVFSLQQFYNFLIGTGQILPESVPLPGSNHDIHPEPPRRQEATPESDPNSASAPEHRDFGPAEPVGSYHQRYHTGQHPGPNTDRGGGGGGMGPEYANIFGSPDGLGNFGGTGSYTQDRQGRTIDGHSFEGGGVSQGFYEGDFGSVVGGERNIVDQYGYLPEGSFHLGTDGSENAYTQQNTRFEGPVHQNRDSQSYVPDGVGGTGLGTSARELTGSAAVDPPQGQQLPGLAIEIPQGVDQAQLNRLRDLLQIVGADNYYILEGGVGGGAVGGGGGQAGGALPYNPRGRGQTIIIPDISSLGTNIMANFPGAVPFEVASRGSIAASGSTGGRVETGAARGSVVAGAGSSGASGVGLGSGGSSGSAGEASGVGIGSGAQHFIGGTSGVEFGAVAQGSLSGASGVGVGSGGQISGGGSAGTRLGSGGRSSGIGVGVGGSRGIGVSQGGLGVSGSVSGGSGVAGSSGIGSSTGVGAALDGSAGAGLGIGSSGIGGSSGLGAGGIGVSGQTGSGGTAVSGGASSVGVGSGFGGIRRTGSAFLGSQGGVGAQVGTGVGAGAGGGFVGGTAGGGRAVGVGLEFGGAENRIGSGGYDTCKSLACDHFCENDNNGAVCRCRRGFYLLPDGLACKDANECQVENGGCDHLCTNTIGSYSCRCQSSGYALANDGKTCVDANECAVNNGRCSHFCENSEGSYRCYCPLGYELQPDGHLCIDINECRLATGHNCQQVCTNIAGAYHCACNRGYDLNPHDLSTCDGK